METSSKITRVVLSFLREEALEPVGFSDDWELEQAQTSLSWLPVNTVELFLKDVAHTYEEHYKSSDLMDRLAKHSFKACMWEGLDTVLKVMICPKPHRMSYFLENFLAYFFSPSPNVTLTQKGMEFSLSPDLNYAEYPLLVGYITKVIEHLPFFVKNNPVRCTWHGDRLSLDFTKDNASFRGKVHEEQSSKTRDDHVEQLLNDLRKKEQLLKQKEEEVFAREKIVKKLLNNNSVIRSILLPHFEKDLQYLLQRKVRSHDSQLLFNFENYQSTRRLK